MHGLPHLSKSSYCGVLAESVFIAHYAHNSTYKYYSQQNTQAEIASAKKKNWENQKKIKNCLKFTRKGARRISNSLALASIPFH